MKLFRTLSEWWSKEKPARKEFNYLYFILIFLFLSLLTSLLIFRGDSHFSSSSLYFLFCGIGQSILEVFFFILISYSLRRWTPKWMFFFFITLVFFLQIVHFIDFTLVRLNDVSLSTMFNFFFGNGVEHIAAIFQGLHLNKTIVYVTCIVCVLLPFFGLFLYWATHKITEKKPICLSLPQILTGISAIALSLLLFDLIAYPHLDRLVYRKYQKVLPFGFTFIAPAPHLISLPKPFAKARSEMDPLPPFSAGHRPNIYFFIIETLRRDFVNQEIAPKLFQFSKEALPFSSSYANANCSQMSWFALLHSDFPHHWTEMRDHWKLGSVPLRILKNMGYQIHVYSSANLDYFGLDPVLFGQNGELKKNLSSFYSDMNLKPWERDLKTIQTFRHDLETREGMDQGHLFLFFLDSTHSEYSFPEHSPPKFSPIVEKIDYLTIKPSSPELEWVKNRYRNSVHSVDALMGQFFDLLKASHLYDSAIISITGDHGEEFYEEGSLFHGTHLNEYQLSVPIFLKFPTIVSPVSQSVTHLDLFPTILHYLTGEDDFSSLFDGESLFKPSRRAYRMAFSQNGPSAPCEFLLASGDKKLTAKFSDTHLEILELNVPDNASANTQSELKEKIDLAFPGAIESLLSD